MLEFLLPNTFYGLVGDITKESAEEIFQKYISCGGNFIDTANKVRTMEKSALFENLLSF